MLIMCICPFVDTARLKHQLPLFDLGGHISLLLRAESLHQLGESVQRK